MANYCFVAPILEGGIELMKKWVEYNIVNNKEHDSVFNAAGISRETVWIQHLPHGDYAVASYETENPEHSFNVLATSNEQWAVKFRDHLKKVHGMDIAQSPLQLNELVVNWSK